MRAVLLLLVFCLTFLGCNRSKESSLSSEQKLGNAFFEYDEIDYYFNNYDESKMIELENNSSNSEIDSLKYGVLLVDIPKDINDLGFVSKLEEMGFKQSSIDKSKLSEINKIFVEKSVTENLATACIYVYRDLLIFKKNREIIGTAKICFGCLANQIKGTSANTENFGQDAYITKRFDVKADGTKIGQEDFASLAQKIPQIHGEQYKYSGNYTELFELIQQYLPLYKLEAPKLLRMLIFNFLFSNGDAHYKNFSILETPLGDYRLSPAYDLLNSRIHINDNGFALDDGLLPKNLAQGKILNQFAKLAELAEISENIFNNSMAMLISKSELVQKMIAASFLDVSTKRNYWQSYQGRLKQLSKS